MLGSDLLQGFLTDKAMCVRVGSKGRMLYSASLSPHSPLSSLLCHLPWEPARMVPETAPPALAIAVEAVILQTREATSVPVPDNAMWSSRSSKYNPNLLTELEFC